MYIKRVLIAYQGRVIIIYTSNDYKILFTLYSNGCTNEMKAYTIIKIRHYANLSIPKIRNTIKKFKKVDYIRVGVSHCNSKTYYVSKKGIEKIKELSE